MSPNNRANCGMMRILVQCLSAISLVALLILLSPSTTWASEFSPKDSGIYITHEKIEIPGISMMSWFGEKLRLASTQTLKARTFDGNNVGIEMTAKCPKDGTFSVTLYRKMSGSNRLRYVGTATFKRNGFTKAVWENVGSGIYQFVCTKSPDGTVVTSSDVAIYSW